MEEIGVGSYVRRDKVSIRRHRSTYSTYSQQIFDFQKVRFHLSKAKKQCSKADWQPIKSLTTTNSSTSLDWLVLDGYSCQWHSNITVTVTNYLDNGSLSSQAKKVQAFHCNRCATSTAQIRRRWRFQHQCTMLFNPIDHGWTQILVTRHCSTGVIDGSSNRKTGSANM